MPRTKNWVRRRATWLRACAGLVVLTNGCATRDAEPAPESAVRSHEPGIAARRAQRGTVIGGERVRRSIVQPTASTRDAVAHARYAADVQEAIARSPVPVLAPADPGSSATMTVGPHWYALTVHGEGFVATAHGSGEARVYPHVRAVDPTHPMRKNGGFLTRTDGIWSASWIEGGAAYSMDIECDRRIATWCDDEAEVVRRVEALVFVGEDV